jgi:hypothetical protein
VCCGDRDPALFFLRRLVDLVKRYKIRLPLETKMLGDRVIAAVNVVLP